MLEKVFQEITHKRKFFASSSTGEQFENKFRNELKKHFSEINGDLIEGLSHIEEKLMSIKRNFLTTTRLKASFRATTF
ncbi:hypothetical protein CHC119_05530 [Helicobacter pylori]